MLSLLDLSLFRDHMKVGYENNSLEVEDFDPIIDDSKK
jgi:hypothetical protein